MTVVAVRAFQDKGANDSSSSDSIRWLSELVILVAVRAFVIIIIISSSSSSSNVSIIQNIIIIIIIIINKLIFYLFIYFQLGPQPRHARVCLHSWPGPIGKRS